MSHGARRDERSGRLAGLHAFERANAAYDDTVARGLADELDIDDAEIAWSSVRDRYRMLLAYPEAVARWPDLAEIARERAGDLVDFVEQLEELQAAEVQAQELAAAGAEMAAARELTARAHAQAVDCGSGRGRGACSTAVSAGRRSAGSVRLIARVSPGQRLSRPTNGGGCLPNARTGRSAASSRA